MQSLADQMFAQMDEDLFDLYGTRAVFNDSYVIDAILDRDVIRQDSFGESIRNNFEITVRNHQVGKLSKNDTIDFAADRYEIVEIILSDSNNTVGVASYVPR